jgi:hypothetical protein
MMSATRAGQSSLLLCLQPYVPVGQGHGSWSCVRADMMNSKMLVSYVARWRGGLYE